MNDFEKKYYESDEFWGRGMVSDDANKTRLETTVNTIPADVASLADIGCGNGVFGSLVLERRKDIKVMSVERSEQALTYVKTEKKEGEVTDIPLPDGSYDCVSCLQVLEHIPVSNYPKALSELARISKKYIIVSVPFNEKIENNVSQCPNCKAIFNVDLHLRSYEEKDIQNLFAKEGFDLVRYSNIIETKQLAGLKLYQKLKGLFVKKPEVFRSPICPICGFENNSFQIIPEGTNMAALASRKTGGGLKGWIKSVWPKNKVPGYWVIALYQKK